MSHSEALRSVQVKIVNVLNDKRVRNFFKITKDVAEAGKGIRVGKPWTYIWGVANIAVSLVDNLEMDEYSYFESGSEWTSLFSKDFSKVIIQAISHFPTKTLNTPDSDCSIRLVDLGGGLQVGWVRKENSHMPKLWCRTTLLSETRERIRDLLWQQYKDDSIVVRKSFRRTNRTHGDDDLVGIIDFEVDDDVKKFSSKVAKKWVSYFLTCMNKDIKRSMLFYGPPGTGKTTMVQSIVSDLKLRSIRVNVTDFRDLDSFVLYDSIDIFKPDVIIVDDIDRIDGEGVLFEALTSIKSKVQFIFATANKPSNLDEGILRPGRFDEIIPITSLDDGVIKFVLGNEYVDAYDDVKGWPIAYIEEFKIQRMLKSPEEARNTLITLQKRVEKLGEYYEEVDVNKSEDK